MPKDLILLIALGASLIVLSPSETLPTEVFIYAIAALGLHVLYGMTGLLSFGQCMFFGGAAYVCGLLGSHIEISVLTLCILGGCVGVAIALLVSLVSMRSRGIYFVMLTLALSQVGYFVTLMLRDTTGGENGLSGVVRRDISMGHTVLIRLQSARAFEIFCAAMLLIAFIAVQRLAGSPVGSVMNAVRLNERRAEVLGYRPRQIKAIAFALSGFLTGVAGCLYGQFLRFVPLNSIDFETSEKLLVMVILGGTGSVFGPVFGSAIFLVAADLLSPIWPRWMMLVGLGMMLIVIFLKRGIGDVLRDAIYRRLPQRLREGATEGTTERTAEIKEAK